MMKGYKPILFKLHIVIILLLFMVLAHPAIAEAKSNKLDFQIQKKTIVIDPGHGGYDKGAKGPDGTFKSLNAAFTFSCPQKVDGIVLGD